MSAPARACLRRSSKRGRDPGAVEFELDPAIESGSQRGFFGFTLRVPHDHVPSVVPTH